MPSTTLCLIPDPSTCCQAYLIRMILYLRQFVLLAGVDVDDIEGRRRVIRTGVFNPNHGLIIKPEIIQDKVLRLIPLFGLPVGFYDHPIVPVAARFEDSGTRRLIR